MLTSYHFRCLSWNWKSSKAVLEFPSWLSSCEAHRDWGGLQGKDIYCRSEQPGSHQTQTVLEGLGVIPRGWSGSIHRTLKSEDRTLMERVDSSSKLLDVFWNSDTVPCPLHEWGRYDDPKSKFTCSVKPLRRPSLFAPDHDHLSQSALWVLALWHVNQSNGKLEQRRCHRATSLGNWLPLRRILIPRCWSSYWARFLTEGGRWQSSRGQISYEPFTWDQGEQTDWK